MLVEEIQKYKNDEVCKVNEAEKQGYENGYNDGVATGYKEVKEQFTDYMETTCKQIISLHTLTKESILNLALEITRKIATNIGSEDVILGIASNALSNYKRDESIKIKLNDVHTEELINNIKNLTKSNGLIIEVIPDQSIGELDCIIISESGVTDASFETQLKTLEQHLKKVQ